MKARIDVNASRLLAILVFVGGPAVLLCVLVLNLLQIADDQALAAEQARTIAALERRLDAPANDGLPVDTSWIYLKGAQQSLALADLQQAVASAVQSTSGKIIETTTIEASAGDDADKGKVQVKVTLDTDNNGLLQLLYLVEGGLPLMTVDDLAVRRLDSQSQQPSDQTLRVDMTIGGVWNEGG